MNKTITQDFLAFEKEAKRLLLIFEKLPDSLFKDNSIVPGAFYVNNVKAYARAYKPLGLGFKEGIVVN